MIDYRYFDMIINKKFIDHYEFYNKIIEHWLYTKKENNTRYGGSIYAPYNSILIYSDKINLIRDEILKIIDDNYKHINIKVFYDNERKFQIQLSVSNNPEKRLIIIIQSLESLELDQRGLRLVGLIVDIDDKNKAIINKYLNDDLISIKLKSFLTVPTNLNIGLVLYY